MQGYAGSITVIGSESEIGEQSSNIRWVSCIQFCRIASGKGMGPSPLPPSYGPNRLRSLGFDDRLSRSNTILNTKLKKALFFPQEGIVIQIIKKGSLWRAMIA